jgi:membrane fusion protein (multidrug efflux system)
MRKRYLFPGLILGLIILLAAAAAALQATGQWPGLYARLHAILSGAPATPAVQQAAKPQGASGGRAPVPVEVSAAKTESFTDSIAVIGSLVAQESVTVAADTPGRIVAVAAVDGAAVKAGDALFRLDGALVDAEVKEAEARLALAETNFRRNQTLARSRNVAQSNVDQAAAELDLARTAMDLAKERQNRLVVRAPFDGHLGFRQVSVGAYVTAGMALVALNKMTTLKVSLSVPERYFTALSVGQKVSLTADAVPGQTFEASVTAINPVIDVNGRALQVQATLDNAGLALRPGMLVRATILGQSRSSVTVTEAAIIPQGRDSVIFTVVDGKAKRLVVTTGQRRDGRVEVRSGLEAGTQVVSAGAARLSDGSPVKASPATATE